METVPVKYRNPADSLVELIQNFRNAAKGHGKYCPVMNELQVRKGRKIYRFSIGEDVLRFTAPGRSEVAFLIAPDATVTEFRRSFAELVDS
jgi:hypothetical protein